MQQQIEKNLILLALDTSANLCAAALYDCQQERILATMSEDIGRGHAERLMDLLAELLSAAGLEYRDIGRIAATIGPGSFTGIRIGLSTARGLALGLGVPVVGVSVLEAIAAQHATKQIECSSPLVVAMDAKRNEIFLQIFTAAGDTSMAPMAVRMDHISSHLPKGHILLAGSAAAMIKAESDRRDIEICSNQTAADIGHVARLAAQKPVEQEKPKPLYMRSADAKPQSNFAVERVT